MLEQLPKQSGTRSKLIPNTLLFVFEMGLLLLFVFGSHYWFDHSVPDGFWKERFNRFPITMIFVALSLLSARQVSILGRHFLLWGGSKELTSFLPGLADGTRLLPFTVLLTILYHYCVTCQTSR